MAVVAERLCEQMGLSPSEMLDYLASRLVESGWSLKAIHRLILLSQAYQLSSEDREANGTDDCTLSQKRSLHVFHRLSAMRQLVLSARERFHFNER